MTKEKIVLTGGGTAGHIWPHFALFDCQGSKLKESFLGNALEVHYMGSRGGMEQELVKAEQPEWHYHEIATGKLRRYFSFQNFLDLFNVILGFFQAFFLLGKIKPGVIFSKGGFVSAPVVWAGWIRKIPVVIHESDATLALATKLTIPFAKKILTSFPETKEQVPLKFQKNVLQIGLPLRESLFSIEKQQGKSHFKFSDNSRKTLLIFGGSLGARSLNEKIFEIIPELVKQYDVIHITGKGNQKNLSVETNHYKQFEFLREEMKFAYAAADLAICRAGASSIFELAAARIPMILIPLGLHASRGDQIINAQIFEKHNWALSRNETEFVGQAALDCIHAVANKIESYKSKLQTAPSKDSAKKIANLLWDQIQEKGK